MTAAHANAGSISLWGRYVISRDGGSVNQLSWSRGLNMSTQMFDLRCR